MGSLLDKIYKPLITLFYMIFHIWDLERVHIQIKQEFLKYINSEIKQKFHSKKNIYAKVSQIEKIPFSTFRNILKRSSMINFFVSLEIYLLICKELNISKEDLEENIVKYKTAGGVNYIENPILPIKITPVFDMLLAHHIGDGTVINPKLGRLPYFGYRQFDKFYRIQYIKKIESVFGDIKFKKDYIENSTRPYCPPVLSSLFFKYYNIKIEDFLSDRARIPPFVFDKEKDSLLAILIAFIIDEGNIDSTQITIHLHNELLIKDLGKICELLGYEHKITKGKYDTGNHDRLHILRGGMKKLWSDYGLLNKRYPQINLGWKGKKIEDSFKIYDRKIIRTKGNNELIFLLLKKEQLSVNQISEILLMTRQGVRYHIHNLLRDKKIKIINKNESNWIYGV